MDENKYDKTKIIKYDRTKTFKCDNTLKLTL